MFPQIGSTQTGKIGGVGGADGIADAYSQQMLDKIGAMGAMDTGALQLNQDQKARSNGINIAQALLHRQDDRVHDILNGMSKT